MKLEDYMNIRISNIISCIWWTTTASVYSVAKNEEWNGASWAEVGDLNQSRIQVVGTGTSTAAMAMGGSIPGPTGYQAITEEWSGSTNSTKTIDTD